ncbi:hypothetical protein CARUB_v10009964mg [Capsella rubella]|uniref:Transmembrane protein n=1 Tax=Capsella rubella TaxID=81985 RepID=R0IMT4_9BRAS|nr:uncharacterized protein LOC17900917 [Capsella rubella]EOA38398.1 hypothetical protein CARUB_v10009964mg [Capsella rubella]
MEHEETQKNTGSRWSLLRPFQMISVSLLSLLVPLSFLFLSRLSISSSSAPVTVSGVFSLLHQADVGVLYTILSLIVVSTLIHNLSGTPKCSVLHAHLYICWIILFIVQACVAFGIEGTMSTTMSMNTDKSFSLAAQERWVLVRVMFFLGLHEVTLMWFRVVVKPVVDDTVFGVYVEEERWSERAVVAVTFGLMWWWRLRDEVESLAVVAEVKRNLLIRLEGLDFVNWWMYYICVGIGLVKIFKGFLYFVNMLILTVKRSRKCCESCIVIDDDTCNDANV